MASVKRRFVAVASAALMFAPGAATAAPRPVIAAADIVADLRDGRSVELADVSIWGVLDLRRAHTPIKGALKCRRCYFPKAVHADGVTFRRAIDFRGSFFNRGATMPEAVFGGDVGFADCTFYRDIEKHGNVTFDYGSVDFGDADFLGRVDFTGAIIGGSSNFSNSRFSSDANFNSARFEKDRAAFYGVSGQNLDFTNTSFPRGGDFGGLTANRLDFTGARFRGRAGFAHITVRSLISFRHAQFDGDLAVSDLSTPALLMDVDDATSVDSTEYFYRSEDGLRETEIDLLKQIESTAKAHDDLDLQNDAHYELQVARSEQYSFPLRVLDWIFYRTITGYLVHPLNPLICWLVFVGIVSIVRLSRRRDLFTYPWKVPRRPLARRICGGASGLIRALEEFAETASSVGPRRAHSNGNNRSALEVNVSRVLLACVLVAAASANPTLRQLIDAF
jgi:uncharacterized protein YjbI with pentapeptide repeats